MMIRVQAKLAAAILLLMLFATAVQSQSDGVPRESASDNAQVTLRRLQDVRAMRVSAGLDTLKLDDAIIKLKEEIRRARREDQRGVDLVTQEWQEQIFGVEYEFAETDVQGNLVLAGGDADAQVGGVVTKLDVSRNSGPSYVWGTGGIQAAQLDEIEDIAIDLDGNIFVCGKTGRLNSSARNRAGLVRVSPEGFINWSREFDPGPDTFATGENAFKDVVLDEDGVPFAVARFLSGDARSVSVFSLNPLTGGVRWNTTIDDLTTELRDAFPSDATVGGLIAAISIGANNQVMVAFSMRIPNGPGTQSASYSALASLDGESGAINWIRFVPARFGSTDSEFLDVDREGRVAVCGSTDGIAVVLMYDTNGLLIAEQFADCLVTQSVPCPSTFTKVRFLRDGTIVACGSQRTPDIPDGALDFGIIYRFALPDNCDPQIGTCLLDILETAGISDSRPQIPTVTPERITDFGVDRLGNVYTISTHTASTGIPPDCVAGTDFPRQQTVTAAKFESGNWSQDVWAGSADSQRFVPAPSGSCFFESNRIVVDPGGNVFTVATSRISGSNARTTVIRKLSQPFVAVPTVQRACVEINLENESVFPAGAGLLAQEELYLDYGFDEGVDEYAGVDAFLFSGGAGFEFQAIGNAKLGYSSQIEGGSVDIHLPIEAVFAIPSPVKVAPGGPVRIVTAQNIDPSARMTTCENPYVEGGVVTALGFSVFSQLQFNATVASIPVLDLRRTLIDIDFDLFETVFPQLSMLGILGELGIQTPVSGEWYEYKIDPALDLGFGVPFVDSSIGLISFRRPPTDLQSCFIGGKFLGRTQELFFKGEYSLNSILSATGLPVDFAFNASGGDDEFGFLIDFRAFGLTPKIDASIRQSLDFTPNIRVRYEFADGQLIDTLPLGEDLVFTMPLSGQAEIVPTLIISGDFDNETDVLLKPSFRWETLKLNTALHVFGENLLDIDECILCFEWGIAEILSLIGIPNAEMFEQIVFNIFPSAAPSSGGGMWNVSFPEQRLPCMRIRAAASLGPRLDAASRENLPMLLYEQISAGQSEFEELLDGGSRFLLYGDVFAGGTAYIEHLGRVEALPTDIVDVTTALVEVPNRFRLLPGVAKLWVENAFGVSETIDLSITYPRPRLDTVNPNIWAADPDFTTLPVSIIDGRDFRGNPSFIARRDYYIRMRDTLWSDSTANGIDAASYFPDFNFNQLPGMPAVLWGGGDEETPVPLPRFIQPVDNGIHNVRLAESNYAKPALVPVRVVNPGPGGGESGVVDLTIAAPVPELSTIEPASVSPVDVVAVGDGTRMGEVRSLDLTIRGPRHVSTLNGYERPKFGNFNADSVVYFNGAAVPTQFVNSSHLEAEIHPEVIRYFNNGSFGSLISGQLPVPFRDVTLFAWQFQVDVVSSSFDFDPSPDRGVYRSDIAELSIPAGKNSAFAEADHALIIVENDVAGEDRVIIELFFSEQEYSARWERTDVSASMLQDDSLPKIEFEPTPDNELTIQSFPKSVDQFLWESSSFQGGVSVSLQGVDLREPGMYEVYVYTPSNGTAYAEELWVDRAGLWIDLNGNGVQDEGEDFPDGVRDPEPVFQGLAESGGFSNTLLFEVRFREPSVISVNPAVITVDNPAFNDSTSPNPGEVNFDIFGNDFRPDSVVYVNGQPRQTVYVSDRFLKAKLLPSDVATIGFVQVKVYNADPQSGISNAQTFEVVVPTRSFSHMRHSQEVP